MIGADSAAARRWRMYGLVLAAAAGLMIGRILQVSSPDGSTPFLSANDRSRWSTVRALVDEGTFAIDDIIFLPSGKRDRNWHTIDLVRRRDSDGQEHYYSSKPPLLTVLLAGEYWLVKQLTGATLADKPLYVGRIMLVLTNVLPLVALLCIICLAAERWGETDEGRLLVVTAAALGTALTTFAVTINNHLPGAVCAGSALWLAWPLWTGECRSLLRHAAAGLFAAGAVVCELPALSFCVFLGAALFWKAPLRALAGYVPAAAAVLAAALGTNYWAHGSWRPPYAHRADGAVLARLDPAGLAELQAGRVPAEAISLAAEHGHALSQETTVTDDGSGRRWILWDADGADRLAITLAPAEAGGGEQLLLRAWDNWYEFEGSYWSSGRLNSVDRGEPSRGVYAFNVLLGHHGLFSLTPIWALSVLGAGRWWRAGGTQRHLAALIAATMLICLAFYLARPLIDRNYGGFNCTFRWLLWQAPLWLLLMIPGADLMARRGWTWGLALLLLAASALSASYNSLNPWTHPWIFDYWTQLGWIAY